MQEKNTPLDGLQLDVPKVFVPWGITEDELIVLIGEERLRHVTSGYYTMSCESLGGLSHRLGLHFLPRVAGRLAYFEFFRERAGDLSRSFADFQKHLSARFGEPTLFGEPFRVAPGKPALPNCRWQIGNVEILHYAMDRFGPEEHLTMRRVP